MIYSNLLVRCFGIGILGTLGLGPIFVLTINRSIIYGFPRGFLTALGASLGDVVLFYLGSVGMLSLMHQTRSVMTTFNIVGGLLLIIIGVRTMRSKKKSPDVFAHVHDGALSAVLKSFVLTVLNPGTIFFFATISLHAFDSYTAVTSPFGFGVYSLTTGAGTLFSLALMSFMASRMRTMISARKLRIIGVVSGSILCLLGLYFLLQSAWNVAISVKLFS